MKRHFVFAVAITATLAFGVFRFGTAAAQDHESHQAPQTSEQSQATPGMLKMHEQMRADMAAADARLDALVKAMNASSGDAKVAAIAAAVSELADQHKSMHRRFEQMHGQMSGRGMMMR